MLSPTTVTPASTVKLWPVFVGLTVTLEKLPVMYRRSIGLTLLLDCVICTLFSVTFKIGDSGKPTMKLLFVAPVAVRLVIVMLLMNGVVDVIGCGGSVQHAGGLLAG